MRTNQVEEVPAVSGMSIWQIERNAQTFLEEWQPDMLCRPEPLDVVGLVDYLAGHDITISPGTPEELGDAEALTTFLGYPEIEIVIEADQWHQLYDRTNTALAHRARATVSHEVGHAVLHADQLYRIGTHHQAFSEAFTRRSQLPAYRDPEWQAWAWAGFVLMPRVVLVELEELTPEYVGEVYDVSPEMARYFLRLLKRNSLL